MARLQVRAARIRDQFRSWTGFAPDGVWRAPGRVNLIGEHLDYNGGHVLPFAIRQSAWLAVRRTDDGVLRSRSQQYPEVVEVGLDELPQAVGWSAYLAGVVWALGQAGIAQGGVDVLVDSDIPQGGGLSSSAALECGLALALADLRGRETDRTDERLSLAVVAQRGESSVAGVPVGVMDQCASLLCTAGHALYLDTATLDFELLPLDLDAAGLRLLAVDTGHPHSHVENEYSDRRRACGEAARILGVEHLVDARLQDLVEGQLGRDLTRRVRHVVTEEARTRAAADALRQGRTEGTGPDEIGRVIGPLMSESHWSMARDFDNSTAKMDAVVAAALGAGAYGARMTGGGWGGTAIVLVAAAEAARVTAAVQRPLLGPGARPVPVWSLRPEAGAERVEAR